MKYRLGPTSVTTHHWCVLAVRFRPLDEDVVFDFKHYQRVCRSVVPGCAFCMCLVRLLLEFSLEYKQGEMVYNDEPVSGSAFSSTVVAEPWGAMLILTANGFQTRVFPHSN